MKSIPHLLRSVNSVRSVSSVFKNCQPNSTNAEHIPSLAPDSSDIILKAATNIAATNLFEIFFRCSDTAALVKRLKEKPELHVQLINCQANLSRADLERQKFELRKKQAEARQRHREQKRRARKPLLLTINPPPLRPHDRIPGSPSQS